MAYEKTVWSDSPSTSSPIIAANLNNIENALYTTNAAVDIVQSYPASLMNTYPTWVSSKTGVHKQYTSDGFVYRIKGGTTSVEGLSIAVLGTDTAKSNDGNMTGYLRLYNDSTGYTDMKGSTSSTNYTITLPSLTGIAAVKQGANISAETNGWYKVNMGAYIIYFKNSTIGSASYAAGGWGSKQVNLPSGVTFNISKMSFSCSATGQDHALRVGTSISNNATSFTVSWHNCYTGSVTSPIIYNAILTDFTTPS